MHRRPLLRMTDYLNDERVKAALRKVEDFYLRPPTPRPPFSEFYTCLQELLAVVAAVSGPARTPEGEPDAWAVVDKGDTIISVWHATDRDGAEQDAKEWAFSANGQPHKPFTVIALGRIGR